MDFSKKNDEFEELEEMTEETSKEMSKEDREYRRMYKKVFGTSVDGVEEDFDEDEDLLDEDESEEYESVEDALEEDFENEDSEEVDEEEFEEFDEEDEDLEEDEEEEEDDAIPYEPHFKPIPIKGQYKNKSGKMKWIIGALVLILFVGIIGVGAFFTMDMYGFGGNTEDVYIEIRQGAGLKEVAKQLKNRDIISSVDVFYFYAKDKAPKITSGGHVFNTSMSYAEICNEMCGEPKNYKIKVVVPEGYELRQIAQDVEKAGLVSAEDFLNAAENDTFDYDFLENNEDVKYKLEGFLYPATYEFKPGTSAHDIIDKMLYTFDAYYTDEYSARAKELGMTDYEVVTFASVVEREAANSAEHKKVAGVFVNRLDIDMKLQSCATVQYIIEERKPVLSDADTEIDSPYNTYMYTGLPVGPVASPSLSAIEAVLYPEEHDYYYFVAKADGSGHVFSKTFAEHQRAMSENQ